ncbi:hypothetical protein [Streptomyces afghaniensis]|nr:hypothetical protein [Streptomyces afghaniensis]
MHPAEFERLRELVESIAARASTYGTIGYLRFLEQETFKGWRYGG